MQLRLAKESSIRFVVECQIHQVPAWVVEITNLLPDMRKVAVETVLTVDEWYQAGRSLFYDLNHKKILSKKNDYSVRVFQKTANVSKNPATRWISFLPGFPDGSFGFAHVNQALKSESPRLFVEYPGNGSSDELPTGTCGVTARADLVEALWKFNGVQRTVVVASDFSSLVVMELLRRQKEQGSVRQTRIEHVISINGRYFASDGKGPKRLSGRLAPNRMLDRVVKSMYGSAYRTSKLSKAELQEKEKAIRQQNVTRLLAEPRELSIEQKQSVLRWNLPSVYEDCCLGQGITFHLVSSDEDRDGASQLDLVHKALHAYYPNVRCDRLRAGHFVATEEPAKIAEYIQSLTRKGNSNEGVARSWTTVDQPTSWNEAPPVPKARPWVSLRS